MSLFVFSQVLLRSRILRENGKYIPRQVKALTHCLGILEYSIYCWFRANIQAFKGLLDVKILHRGLYYSFWILQLWKVIKAVINLSSY